jgi:hypothetical protein
MQVADRRIDFGAEALTRIGRRTRRPCRDERRGRRRDSSRVRGHVVLRRAEEFAREGSSNRRSPRTEADAVGADPTRRSG